MSEKFTSKQDKQEAIENTRDFIGVDKNGNPYVPAGSDSMSGTRISNHQLKMIEAHAGQLHEGYAARESENMLKNAVGILTDPKDIRESLYAHGFIDDDEYSEMSDEDVTAFVNDARAEVAGSAGQNTPSVEEEEPAVAEITPSEYVPKHRGEYRQEENPLYEELKAKYTSDSATDAPASKPFDVKQEVEDAKVRLNSEADEKASRVIDALNNTDQARADRELLNPVSLDGLEPVDGSDAELSSISVEGLEPVDGPNIEPAHDNESLEEYEVRTSVTRELEPIEVKGLDPIETDDEATVVQSRVSRMRTRFSPTALAARAGAWNYQRGERAKTREQSDDRERSDNKKAIVGLGVLGVIAAGTGIYLANKYGLDFQPGKNGGPPTGVTPDVIPNGTGKSGGNGLSWNDFDPSARRVTPGEGFYSTFDQMGIPKSEWSDVLNTAGPKLGKLGEAYYDNNAKEWRISRPGQLSSDALRVIASNSRKNGVDL